MNAGDADSLLQDARHLLRSQFGFDAFLPGQAEPLAATLAGRDALAVMPTGSGKSLLYQLPAAMGQATRSGLVVVASPLIALMRDQLRALAEKGVPAAALHSAQDDGEAAAAIDAISRGAVRLVYAAPERLAQEGAQQLLRKQRIKLFAIDEAHCVSHWGHEFRPDYRALGDIARKLGAPPILAVTATAGPQTRDDIVRLLFARPPEIFLRSFARPNLSLAFERKSAGLRRLLDFAGSSKESGIVYVNARRRADELARDLARLGLDALPYHAGLDAYTREAHQDAFFARDGVVMVATIAFGMGVDKPNVRYIIHADLPTSVEGYYQEIGRAGRDGAPARALAFYTPRELALRWRPPLAADESAAGDAARRKAMVRLAAAFGCRFQALLSEFGEASTPCGKCDHCRGGLLGLPKRLSALAQNWRARMESSLALALGEAARDDEANIEGTSLAAAEQPQQLQQDAAEGPSPDAALNVAAAKRLRVLETTRLSIARRRKVAPRAVASAAALRAIADKRPTIVTDPLFAGVEDAEVFLRALDKAADYAAPQQGANT